MFYIITLATVFHEANVQIHEQIIRAQGYKIAKRLAQKYNKPLIVIGNPKGRHPCGDITIDIKPLGECPVELKADVSNLSTIPDKYAGCVFISHVLEHLPPDKAKKALSEINRISHTSVIVFPTKYSILARIIPDHNLTTLSSLHKISPHGIVIKT